MRRFWRASWDAILPVTAGVILALPCLSFGYFWDDFAFLTRAQQHPLSALGYQDGSAFYRPLSQGLYFLPLAHLGSSGAMIAHVLNLLLLAASGTLIVLLTRRLAGRRAGVMAGLLFVGIAPVASLVGWASGAQDLLAITFLLCAFYLRHAGNLVGSGVALIAALLSKETAAVALPGLVFWDLIVGRKPARVAGPALVLGSLMLLWAAFHPGLGLFLKNRFDPANHYLGFRNVAVSGLHERRYLLALINVPVSGWATPWPWDRTASGALAALVGLAALGIASRTPDTTPSISPWRMVLLGTLLAAPALLVSSLLIQRWVAYYVCLPAVGTAIIFGTLAARIPLVFSATALMIYLALGTWSRGAADPSGTVLTERSFVHGSRAIHEVERGFRELEPKLPHRAQLLVSVASSGALGIHGTLHDGQAPRVWYDDPTLITMTPERRVTGRAEYLFRISKERDVLEIMPDRLAYRAARGTVGAEDEIRAVTRTYARGLAASGETERSVFILQRLALSDPPPLRSYDLRLAAMGYLAAGDRRAAERVLDAAPPITREVALDAVAKIMAEPTRRADWDSCAYWAFGISAADPQALRYWMAMFYGSEFYPQALASARRLLEVAPGDPESAQIVRELGSLPGGLEGPGPRQ